jgi:hypothetical protein
MEPLTVAARFAAFTCYLNSKGSASHSVDDAASYARQHWKRFLPYVGEDLARFLTSPATRLSGRTRTCNATARRVSSL